MKKNWLLTVGVAIPIIVVAAVAISIYVPRLYVHMAYNFVYAEAERDTAAGPCAGTGTTFSVVNGKIVEHQTVVADNVDGEFPFEPCGVAQNETLYLYDVRTNSSTEIAPADEASYTLDTGTGSPDGFTVGPSDSNGGALFFSAPYSPNTVYATKGTYSRRLNTTSSGNTDESFIFLGWVK